MQSNVLSIGRLVPRKGHIYLIDAVRKLADEGMSLKLVIVGAGPEEHKIRQRAKGLDLRLELVASDDKLREEYHNADVFVLPSVTDEQGEKEGLGLVLPEAMHFKLPVIAFDNGGIHEAVIDGYNGILLPEKDVNGLAASIKKVLTDQDFRKRLVETAYEDVHERFSIETIVEQHIEVYDEVLEHE